MSPKVIKNISKLLLFLLVSCTSDNHCNIQRKNILIKENSKENKKMTFYFLDSLEEKYQEELDSGINMLKASRKHNLYLKSLYYSFFEALGLCETTINYNHDSIIDKQIELTDKLQSEFEMKFNTGEWGEDMYMMENQILF